jgi:quercetin dioxygenase-like cupin family protein
MVVILPCAAQCSAGGRLLLRYHRPHVPARIAAVLLLALSCSASAQDPVSLAPALYKVEIDNAWVRVLRLTLGPHAKTPRHSHPPEVLVWVNHDPGRTLFRPAATEVEENPSDEPVEEIVIELKPNVQTPVPITLDPVTLDPDHHLVVLDTPRVRALRTILEPGIESPLHEHPHYVVVYITELHTTMTLGDGRVVDNPRRPGDVAWRDVMTHRTLNVGRQTAVEIQVELK